MLDASQLRAMEHCTTLRQYVVVMALVLLTIHARASQGTTIHYALITTAMEYNLTLLEFVEMVLAWHQISVTVLLDTQGPLAQIGTAIPS
jgi:hypothetical protein